jgi:cyclopropane fatty-acyl-phospholipid synthase-like methyltransferase
MSVLLVPGRHLLTSQFMVEYFESILAKPIHELLVTGGNAASTESISHIIFPITSANQHGSRYNPVPLYARVAGLERTIAQYRERYGIKVSYVPVPHIVSRTDFASYILKHVATHLTKELSPTSTIVWTSTDTLITDFNQLGFSVLPAEWDVTTLKYTHKPPTHIIRELVTAPWSESNPAYALVSEATRTLWNDMPEIPAHIIRLWNDPILTDSGSLTDTRNYGVYTVGMGQTDVLDVKFADIKQAIKEGRIVDEGCADGALMVRLAERFPDSDIIGIDITGEFVSRVEERQRAGDFGNSFVHVYQRNILEPVFTPASIDTVICNSTLHELWSYGEQAASVRKYLRDKYTELVPGGRLVIRDVVGPEDKEKTIYMKLRDDDGLQAGVNDVHIWNERETRELSTKARFYRFAHDFLRELREAGRRDVSTQLTFAEVERDGEQYICLSLKSAAEFLSRKDYHDNWQSEMNEEFTFWDFAVWQAELKEAGFTVVHDTSESQTFSHTYRNAWITKHRYEPCAALYEEKNGELVPCPFPVTTMVLVGEKQIAR